MSLLSIVVRCAIVVPLITPIDSARADARQDANGHYEAGVIAFEELRFADAATEFELAYAQVPAWQVLYNLGAVYAALGQPVQAISAFSRYLEQADASIGAERRQQVQDELEKQRAKTGLLEVRVEVARAEIRIDGRSVGVSPLSEPIRLVGGAHVVEVHREGLQRQRREAIVTAGHHTRLDVALPREVAPSVPVVSSAPVAAGTPALAGAEIGTDPGSVHRVLGFSLGGAGLLSITVGAILTATGQGKHHDAVDLANAGRWPEAEALESNANAQKTLGFTTMGVGAAFLLTGAAFVLLAPDSPSAGSGARVAGWASAHSGGVLVKGDW